MDAGAAGVVQTDAGHSHLHGFVHHFADFLRHGFRQGTAVYGEVLGEYINQAAIDGSASGNNTVAQILFFLHSEVGATMELEHVHLFKTALV